MNPHGLGLATGLGAVLITSCLLMSHGVGTAGQASVQAAARIDRLLADSYPSSEPGAAVLVSKAGTIILEKGYGLADTARSVPVTPATVFRLASVTKVFAGTAILMLSERGMLSLDDPVRKHLPAFPASRGTITVRHLLSHTSGLADYLDRPDSMEWANHEYTVQALIDAFKDRPAAFPPGEQSAYSNSDYVLLGAIAEKVSGLSFAAFAAANLFKPLGMASSSCGGTWADIPALATAYEPARAAGGGLDWGRLLVARPYTMSSLFTAGGCVSSARDLSKFHGALLGGALIGRPLLAQSFAPVALPGGRRATVSLGGWQLDLVRGRRAAMRGGALPGVCTSFLTMPDDRVGVVLLSNRTPGKPRCGMLAVQVAGLAADR
jgi:CubicO group peptidase (beta-lactamase class C family)